MKKIIQITGMSCSHCQARVEKELNSISGVTARVDLGKARAIVSLDQPASDEVLIEAVEKAGYAVTDIREKKGIF